MENIEMFPSVVKLPTISRSWAMPNKNTFNVNVISDIIKKYGTTGLWIDPFANNNASKRIIGNNVITNDINDKYKTDYNLDALEFLKLFSDVEGVIFDPPYSTEQCLRRYTPKHNGTAGRAEYWAKCKDIIATITKKGATVISFAWDSTGMGKKRGFDIVEIKLVCHGACHNDTIITVEQKCGA